MRRWPSWARSRATASASGRRRRACWTRCSRRSPRSRSTTPFAKARDELREFTGVARRRRRRRFAASCAPTRRPASAGCPSCASSGSAAASRTTWASARRSRCWRCWPGGRRRRRPPFDRRGAEVAGLELGAGGGALRAGAARRSPTSAPSAPRARPRCDAASPSADLVVTTYGMLRKDVVFAARDRGRTTSILDEAQAIKNADSESAKAARLLRGRPSPGALAARRSRTIWASCGR